MPKTAINLYSVRELDESLLEILDRVAAAGYDGVQFSGGLRDADPAEVVTKLEETGLATPSAHIDIDVLESDFEATYERYAERFDCEGAVIPYLGEDHFESVESVETAAERVNALASMASEFNWTIHYHNHAHEFTDIENRTAFDHFLNSADGIQIELDVGWALVGGADPAELINTYNERIDLLHMKDMVTDEEWGFRELGEGDVDIPACANAAREANIEWLIYEHDDPQNPAESIDIGASVLKSL